ncbi:uncharacterized protein BCR38DRAFT_236167 [Pseudomassariella vexata]|uniref:Uncharacterized protein n=1 Tax=Pseudomassariella vexata TaxID=1141098 RepID=A0A1Y2DSN0_9PEZI|nr:uncharacterized protein BCR38DRAFT_236167 [Pseudomassariella vexata]ORY62267.1 hypothetical protein BCR38DRAFT_236167 [Pseudomassariella vexata]
MMNSVDERLAADYMVGWDVKDATDRRLVGLAAANGWGEAADLKVLTRYSLLRGVEEWSMMISCAGAMKKEQSDVDPLDGQDPLSYISKLLVASTEADSNELSNGVSGLPSSEERDAPPPAKAPRGKRKRTSATESHFFSGDNTSKKQKKASKKEKRKVARAGVQLKEDKPISESIQEQDVDMLQEEVPVLQEEVSVLQEEVPVLQEEAPVLQEEAPALQEEVPALQEEVPVLQDAAVWYRSEDNIPLPNATDEQPKAEAETEAPIASEEDDGSTSLKSNHS